MIAYYVDRYENLITPEGQNVPKSAEGSEDFSGRLWAEMRALVEKGDATLSALPDRQQTVAQQIAELEHQVTSRHVRNAVLGDQYAISKIREVEERIGVLRG